MSSAGEIDAGNLQVAAIDVALVERYVAIDCYLLVRALDHRVTFRVGEAHGAVFGIVDSAALMFAEQNKYFRFSVLLSSKNEIKCRKSVEMVEKSPFSCAYVHRNIPPSKSSNSKK